MNVLIIGVGLIGGSFALALRDRGLAERIEGVEASEEHARRALERGLVDRIVTLEEGLPSADLIVLATPVDTIPLLTVKILNRIAPHQVVMDTGSIKGELCEVVAMHARRGRFVATHPMWGTEYSGPDAASRGRLRGPDGRDLRARAQRPGCGRDRRAPLRGVGNAAGVDGAGGARPAYGLCLPYFACHVVRTGAHRVGEGARGAAYLRPGGRRLRIDGATGQECTAARGCRFCCATSTMCSTCCASISTSCRSCAA